jgi:hypothetical protein
MQLGKGSNKRLLGDKSSSSSSSSTSTSDSGSSSGTSTSSESSDSDGEKHQGRYCVLTPLYPGLYII